MDLGIDSFSGVEQILQVKERLIKVICLLYHCIHVLISVLWCYLLYMLLNGEPNVA